MNGLHAIACALTDNGSSRDAAGALAVPQLKGQHRLALDPDDVDTNIPVIVPPYEAMRVDDSITFTFAYSTDPDAEGWERTKTLTASDLGRPMQWNLPQGQLYMVDGGTALVRYRVSYANGAASESAQQHVLVSAPQAPLLAAAHAEGVEDGSLDPGRFPGGLTVWVDPYPGLAIGDHVLLHWRGANDQKSTVKCKRVDASVVDSGVIAFTVEPSWLEASAGGNIEVTYQFARPGAADSSLPLSLRIRAPRADLPPPVVEGAVPAAEAGPNAGNLAADLVRAGAYVRVPDDATIGDGESIAIYWQGHRNGGDYVADRPVAGSERRFFIPAAAIGANMGNDEAKRFPVIYKVTSVEGDLYESEAFRLKILPLPVARYPAVSCPQATGKPGLRPADVPDGADLVLQPWVFINAGQVATLEVTSLNSGGQPVRHVARDKAPVTSGEVVQGLRANVPRGFLLGLQPGAQITMLASISFDGESAATVFPISRTVWLG
ncbi:hypothetical protein [Mesorhizobium retamae]|uniref:Uncharacterized protein n=1 Tax=Mesorhizobium retamae TaxID=2912854 RepID=A0ABS9QP68_9HYPH|nr:hypothetical protein [Mesorhizobium sp. IRAMC:0171]MCG7509239.1 hypothetical protein [Mesorhizobium sp. IRAMC:0171]